MEPNWKYKACDGCENNSVQNPCPERPLRPERWVVNTVNGCDRAIVDGQSGRMVRGKFTSLLDIMAEINKKMQVQARTKPVIPAKS